MEEQQEYLEYELELESAKGKAYKQLIEFIKLLGKIAEKQNISQKLTTDPERGAGFNWVIKITAKGEWM